MEGFRPDIAAFQELFNRPWAQEVQKRSGLGTLVFSEEACGLAILTNFPVRSWGVIKLSKSPMEEYLRYLLWAELKVKGEQLVIFNTHLSWMLEDGASRQKQVEEVLQAMEQKASRAESMLVGDLNAPPESLEIQWLIKEGKFRDVFLEKHPHEVGISWDNKNPYAGGAFHKLPDRRIDYILARGEGPILKTLVSSNLVFTKPSAAGIWASDHYGVLAEFK